MSKDSGYLLPEVVNPDRVSFCIEIPNDFNHILAFWGQMSALGFWWSWQRDEAHTGKDAAAVWSELFDINFNSYMENSGTGCNQVTQYCCDETNDLLRQMLAIMQGGFKIVPITQELPSDFTVDCTPDGFTGNEDETPTEKIKRQNALCLAVNRWLVSILGNRADKMNQSSKLNDIWALGGFTAPPKMYAQIQYVEFAFTVAQLQTIIDDETAFQIVACKIIQELANEGNTFSIFKKLMQDVYDEVSAEENVAQTLVALVAQKYATDRVNYTLFSKELERAYEDINDGDDYACLCFGGVCDVEEFDLISENDATVINLGGGVWQFTQNTVIVDGGDVQRFYIKFRDAYWRCFNHISSSVGQSYYQIYNCAGVFGEGVGGGGGEIIWHNMEISFPSGSHITPPLVMTVTITCP